MIGDGKGPLPDSRLEILADLVLVGAVFLLFGFFTGLDAQVNHLVSAPSDYLVSQPQNDSLYFSSESMDLMNSVSENSIGFDAVADERLYCGEVDNQRVVDFRFADSIDSSSLTSVSGSCVRPVDVFVHSQPDGSEELSSEDKDLESDIEYTCIQFQEISSSPVTKGLGGLNCWKVVDGGESFESVDVFLDDRS